MNSLSREPTEPSLPNLTLRRSMHVYVSFDDLMLSKETFVSTTNFQLVLNALAEN